MISQTCMGMISKGVYTFSFSKVPNFHCCVTTCCSQFGTSKIRFTNTQLYLSTVKQKKTIGHILCCGFPDRVDQMCLLFYIFDKIAANQIFFSMCLHFSTLPQYSEHVSVLFFHATIIFDPN